MPTSGSKSILPIRTFWDCRLKQPSKRRKEPEAQDLHPNQGKTRLGVQHSICPACTTETKRKHEASLPAREHCNKYATNTTAHLVSLSFLLLIVEGISSKLLMEDWVGQMLCLWFRGVLTIAGFWTFMGFALLTPLHFSRAPTCDY